MAYAVLDKALLRETTLRNAYVGKVTVKKTKVLRNMEKENIIIPWKEWLSLIESERG